MTETPTANLAGRWRTAAALGWMCLTLAVLCLWAARYSGLYEALAEFELSQFGAFEPSATFFVLLIVLWAPVQWIAPASWRKPAVRTSTKVDVADAWRSTRRIMTAIALGSLLVGLGAGAFALWRAERKPTIAQINLDNEPAVIPTTDQLVVSGRLQRRYAYVIETNTRGTISRTLYTPLTANNWRPDRAVRFVTRDVLGSTGDVTFGEVGPEIVRFGPAAVSRHAPGMVRAQFHRQGLTLSSHPVFLDEHLESANDTLWIIAFFGVVFGLSGFLVSRLIARRQAVAEQLRAAGREPPQRLKPRRHPRRQA